MRQRQSQKQSRVPISVTPIIHPTIQPVVIYGDDNSWIDAFMPSKSALAHSPRIKVITYAVDEASCHLDYLESLRESVFKIFDSSNKNTVLHISCDRTSEDLVKNLTKSLRRVVRFSFEKNLDDVMIEHLDQLFLGTFNSSFLEAEIFEEHEHSLSYTRFIAVLHYILRVTENSMPPIVDTEYIHSLIYAITKSGQHSCSSLEHERLRVIELFVNCVDPTRFASNPSLKRRISTLIKKHVFKGSDNLDYFFKAGCSLGMQFF